jgi:hypothetical protein
MERADHVLVPKAESLDGVYDVWVLVAAGVAIRALGWVPCIRIFDEAQTGQDNQEDRDEALHDANRQCVANVDSCRFGGRDIDGRVLSDEVAPTQRARTQANRQHCSSSLCQVFEAVHWDAVFTLASSCYKEAVRWYCVPMLAIPVCCYYCWRRTKNVCRTSQHRWHLETSVKYSLAYISLTLIWPR